MFGILLAFFALVLVAVKGDFNYPVDKKPEPLSQKDMTLISLNVSTGGPYTYSQSQHHFYGTGYDGSYIDTYGCCCGQSGN